MYKYRFSIFTATYNRATMLQSLYQNILNQDFDKTLFEWVIVSDGSTDNTDDVVASFISEGKINIQYKVKDNGGKHSAWREASKMFEGRYVVTADDDDPISSDMLSVFDKYWKELEMSDQYSDFWEIRTRAQYENGNLVGEPLPLPYFDSDYIEVNYRLKKSAEMVGCRKVEILRNEAAVPDIIPFEGKCSNYPECIRWTKAALKYRTRFVPDVTRTYMVGHESLTINTEKRTDRQKYNSLVYSLCCLNEIGEVIRKSNLKEFCLIVLQLAYSSIRLRTNVLSLLSNNLYKILVALFYFPALLIYIFRK